MGCTASRPEENLVVLLCKERKHFLKLAVERQNALANAHCRYIHSYLAMAAAIKLFVAQHSSPSSPFLITFHPSNSIISNPTSSQQTPLESTEEPKAHQSSNSLISSESSEAEREDELGREVCPYFYTDMPPPTLSAQRVFGWDFFDAFSTVQLHKIGGFSQSSNDNLGVVREEENNIGLGNLQEPKTVERNEAVAEKDNNKSREEIVKVTSGANVNQEKYKELRVTNTLTKGLELLIALKDVEDNFLKAYDSVQDVSRMLIAKRVHQQPSLEEIKENSTKLHQAIAGSWFTLPRSTSSKSSLASSSKSSSTWTDIKSDPFDDYGGMKSGSHSMTLRRLYTWEKKLHEEVKAGNHTRKVYERTCAKLRNQDVRGDDMLSMDQPGSVVIDLYTRILVSIHTAEMTSKRIQKLRDEEFQPQVIELLQGLMKTWKIMLESHDTQNFIMLEVKAFTCPTYGKFCNESHRVATLKLIVEIQNWHECFTKYIAAQRTYVEALNGWLSKFIIPEVEFYSRSISSVPPYLLNGPPLLMICHDWLTSLEKLPVKPVVFSMKRFAKDVQALWVQQGKEQQQKRKVENLTKELDKRVNAFKWAENRILEHKLSEKKAQQDVQHRVEYLAVRKDLLNKFRKKLDAEKIKHYNFMQETQQITLNGFQTGLSSIFESLVDISKASINMYNELLTYSEKAK